MLNANDVDVIGVPEHDGRSVPTRSPVQEIKENEKSKETISLSSTYHLERFPLQHVLETFIVFLFQASDSDSDYRKKNNKNKKKSKRRSRSLSESSFSDHHHSRSKHKKEKKKKKARSPSPVS